MNMNNYKASHKKRNQKQFNNYMYSPSNNDYDLQNRINKSLYPYNSSQRTSTINNISDYNYNSDSNYDLIEDFKDTLRKTQLLKDELINKNTFYKGNFNINYKYNKNLNSGSKISSEGIDSDDNSLEDSEEKEEEEEDEEENENLLSNKEKEININKKLEK